MKRTFSTAAGTFLLITVSTIFAQYTAPGPYPVIFIHGNNPDAVRDFWMWDSATSSAKKEIVEENNGAGYAGYQSGGRGDAVTFPSSSNGDQTIIYNFAYYLNNLRTNERGVIGDADGQFYPKSTMGVSGTDDNIREYYQHSADNESWAHLLAVYIDSVLAATGASKVNLVCHSMGGLVARAAITYYGCEDKVYKVLFIGTPNHGFNNGPLKELIASMVPKKFQRIGEYLEMKVPPKPFASTKFFNTAWSGEKKGWPEWLEYYDPGGDANKPVYGTIAGTKPRWYTVTTVENDGLVSSKSVYLSSAVFNKKVKQWHSNKNSGDQYEKYLPTSEYTEDIIKHWILDYHRPPEIMYVDWLKVGCGGVMGIIVLNYWKPHVYFQFTKTPGWSFNWYHGYCYDPHIEMVGMHPQWVLWRLSFSTSNYYKRDFIDNKVPFYMSGEPGYWYVHAKQTYSGYDTTFSSGIFTANAPIEVLLPEPGCPMLFSFMGTDSSTQAALFVENNTLLPHSEHETDTATDNMVLSYPPPAHNGHYYLNISENSTETSYFDRVKLYAVDHPEGTQVVTSEDGNTYVYSDEILANQAITWTSEILQDSAGNPVEYFYSLDHLDYVQHLDKYIWVGEDGDSLFVSFPPISADWTNVGLLVSVGPGRGILPDTSALLGMGPDEGSMIDPDKKQQHTVYSGNGSGGWIPQGKAYCRLNTSDWLIDVTPAAFMTEENEGVTFKIVASAENLAYIDRVALVKLETSGWSMTEAQLDGAKHWEYDQGVPTDVNITSQIAYYDGMFAPELKPEQQYALSFINIPEDTTMSRDFVLQTHGVYGPPGFQLNLAPSGSDEDPSLPFEYNLELDQQILRSHVARICYQIPQAGRTTIEVLDVTGRRVTKLVDEQLNPGSYSINWNRTDDANRQISTGVYFIRMVSGDFASNAKLVILK